MNIIIFSEGGEVTEVIGDDEYTNVILIEKDVIGPDDELTVVDDLLDSYYAKVEEIGCDLDPIRVDQILKQL